METYGFDLAFARTLDAVNADLTEAFGTLDMTVSDSGEDSSESATYSLEGAWGAWQIVTGGSNSLLRFRLPFKSGTLIIDCPALNLDHATYDLTGVSVEVEMQLGWLGAGSVQPSGQGQETKLVFDIQQRGTTIGDTTQGAVTAVSVADAGGHLDLAASSLLEEIIADVLIANRDKISVVFAEVLVSPPGADAWQSPTRWRYYYQEPKDGPAVLCVLSVLTNRDLPEPAFDASVLSDDATTFLILSNEQFLRHAVLPSLPAAYGGASFSYQATGDTTGRIVNTSDIPTPTVKWGLDSYYPRIKSFTLSVDGSDVVTRIDNGRCDITGLANAYITFSGDARTACSYGPSSGRIDFSKPSPKIDHSKHIPWYDYALGALAGGAGVIIIDTIISAVTDTVASDVNDSTSSIASSGLAGMTASACRWGGDAFTPSGGGLAGAFWMRGT